MAEENMNRKLGFQKIDEIRNYLTEEINRMNYHSLIVSFAFTGCVSISTFASLVGIAIRIRSSAIGLKMCVITAAIKWYKWINK